MPASSAKNKGEQGFLFMYKLDVIEACVMQEAHTHQQQQHLVVREMTDLYAHFTWIKSERERKSTMEKSTRKNDGQHIWHPYREAFKEINLKEEHQSPEPRVSSLDIISSNVITLSSIPFSRTCNHVCRRFVYNITLVSTYHDGHREREREVLKLLQFFLSCQICMIHIQCGGKEAPIWRPSPSFCLQKRTEQWATLTNERSSSAQS
jgi:hypothetical protein